MLGRCDTAIAPQRFALKGLCPGAIGARCHEWSESTDTRRRDGREEGGGRLGRHVVGVFEAWEDDWPKHGDTRRILTLRIAYHSSMGMLAGT
eukprot:3905397-Rhodomonas_salina.3